MFGQEQFQSFAKECLIERMKAINDVIYYNKYKLFKKYHSREMLANEVLLKCNMSILCWISNERMNVEGLFCMKTKLTHQHYLMVVVFIQILKVISYIVCLQAMHVYKCQCDALVVDAIIIDGAVIVQMLLLRILMSI